MSATSSQRDEVRDWIRKRMENGELSEEPEMHLESREGGGTEKKNGTLWGGKVDASLSEIKSTKGANAKDTLPKTTVGGVEADDFFGDDDDESEES